LSGKIVYKYADPGEQNKEYVMKNANLVLKVGFFEKVTDGTFNFVSDITISFAAAGKRSNGNQRCG
jgi:hypothetical protein